ncbi:branched-chain-amino-acid transaminase 1 [Pullulanibacillus camelliae]|uniref:Branched-chain-amino-acid aminotransferase n=1 Tax=Pullulanibacillus camelliae TaxID=1707096 RepID=A0A8J2VNE6_9BACL|nr:branched-chain amino acid aminotransferase [Pullulanibacillus camelliae]GGE33813.1 branched-chain-amino-acid transaminase 1 [Pullulanibacillus camelliae]
MKQVIDFVKTNREKEKQPAESLGFGKYFTDHMFVMDYDETRGWHEPKVVPYQPLTLEPSSMVFHYGQAIFEGLKAYRTQDGKVQLFRPNKNIERLNFSCQRMSIPTLDEELVLDAIMQLITIEKDWVPDGEGTSLYIRPFIIATEPYLGVRSSKRYKFLIILSPVGSYYGGDQLKPVKIYVEENYVRAAKGGVGHVKTSGNYAASLKAQEEAEALGYDQVLWLDAKENKYVEEVGSMNIFFKIKGEVVTPQLNGSILSGITRSSVLQLLEYWNVPVSERKISIEEVFDAYYRGELEEAFGAGTAAVISPVGELSWNNQKITFAQDRSDNIAKRLYESITNIQLGKEPDPFQWTLEVK